MSLRSNCCGAAVTTIAVGEERAHGQTQEEICRVAAEQKTSNAVIFPLRGFYITPSGTCGKTTSVANVPRLLEIS